jgi:hypothetical protein
VKLSRLRSGELVALLGAVALAVLLALDWFAISTPQADLRAHESGIRALGWLAALLLLAAITLAIALAVATATQRAPAVPVVLGVLTVALGILATLAILVRLVLQPGLGVDAGNADVDLRWPAYAGLLAALLLTAGAWRAMGDERTDAPDSLAQRREVLAAAGVRPAPPRSAAIPRGPADPLADPPR